VVVEVAAAAASAVLGIVVVVVVVEVVAAAAAVVTSDLHQELPKFPIVSLLLRKRFCASKNKSTFSLHS